jgi:hypothetical protein
MKNYNTCAPAKYDKENNTCFTTDQLVEMAKGYNRYVSKKKLSPTKSAIEVGGSSLIEINPDKKYLLTELRDKFKIVCKGENSDMCITQQQFMNEITGEMHDDITQDTFRPGGPAGAKEWLSTTDIDGVMAQYEKVYPNFKFLGAVPRDCDQLNFCSLHGGNFSKLLSEKKEQIGIIFNLDAYGESGSHWVAMYLNIPKGECYYCDSLGKKPLDDMLHYIDQYKKFYKKEYGKDIDFQWNKNAYQKDSSECGIYSCNFIIRKLAGESFDHITSHPLTFEQINSCRNVYFNNKPSKFTPDAMCEPAIKTTR